MCLHSRQLGSKNTPGPLLNKIQPSMAPKQKRFSSENSTNPHSAIQGLLAWHHWSQRFKWVYVNCGHATRHLTHSRISSSRFPPVHSATLVPTEEFSLDMQLCQINPANTATFLFNNGLRVAKPLSLWDSTFPWPLLTRILLYRYSSAKSFYRTAEKKSNFS